MAKFDDIIRKKLESYEASYDASSWSSVQQSLDTSSGSSTFQTALIAGVAANVLLGTLFVTLPNMEQDSGLTPVVTEEDVPTVGVSDEVSAQFEEHVAQEAHEIVLASVEEAGSTKSTSVTTKVKTVSKKDDATDATPSPKSPDTREVTSAQHVAAKRMDFSAKGIECVGSDVTFSAKLEDAAQVTWLFDGLTVKEGLSVVHSFDTPGVHETRMVVAFKDGTEQSMTKIIEIFETPSSMFYHSVQDNTKCSTVKLVLSGEPDSHTYRWLVDGDSVGRGTELSTQVTPGLHEIEMLVINEEGCTSLERHQVRVEGGIQVFPPNVFSPLSQDGRNDSWFITGLEGTNEFNIQIVRLQTNEVAFESNDPTFKWNGNIAGRNEMPRSGEVFIWKMNAIDDCGNLIQRQGNITIYNNN